MSLRRNSGWRMTKQITKSLMKFVLWPQVHNEIFLFPKHWAVPRYCREFLINFPARLADKMLIVSSTSFSRDMGAKTNFNEIVFRVNCETASSPSQIVCNQTRPIQRKIFPTMTSTLLFREGKTREPNRFSFCIISQNQNTSRKTHFSRLKQLQQLHRTLGVFSTPFARHAERRLIKNVRAVSFIVISMLIWLPTLENLAVSEFPFVLERTLLHYALVAS